MIPHCCGFKSACVQTDFSCSMKIVEGQTEPPVAINSVTSEMNARDKDGKEDRSFLPSLHSPRGAVRLTTARALKTL